MGVATRMEWISVKDAAPEFGCVIIDTMHNLPYFPIHGIVTIKTKDGNRYFAADENFNFDIEKFMKGRKAMLDGKVVHLLPKEIEYWCNGSV